MDSFSMYTKNIDTDHGLEILARFLDEFKDDLPAGFSYKVGFEHSAHLVMTDAVSTINFLAPQWVYQQPSCIQLFTMHIMKYVGY